MKEREESQFSGVRLPPVWCGAICRNAMNEICVESCALKRDCSAFEPKPDLSLSNMPPFPLNDSVTMTKEEKFASVTIYLSKVVDHLTGTDFDSQQPVTSRSSGPVQVGRAVIEIASGLKNLQNTKENE
jgi:hypothetical protein